MNEWYNIWKYTIYDMLRYIDARFTHDQKDT